MSAGNPQEDPFVSEIRRQAERAGSSRRPTFWRGVAAVGSVGWMVSLPAVAGALVGRWLDVKFASGIFWTLSLLVAGVFIGCATAWRHVQQEMNE